MISLRPGHLLAAIACIAPLSAAQAAVVAPPPVAIGSAVYVEHLDQTNRVVQRTDQLRRGDRVITILSWRRALPGGAFTVVNPLPRTIRFDGSADGREDVSADGGRTWGRLGQLRVGPRLATAQDVTHIRWRIASPAPAGQLAYRAIVR